MLTGIFTAGQFDGHRVENGGVVFEPVTYGSDIFKDFFASVRNFVGGRVASMDKLWAEATREAQRALLAQAQDHGYSAVINFRLVRNVAGKDNGIISIEAWGDAANITSVEVR